MRISGLEVGHGFPCRIVAEISNAHNGDRDRCGRLIDAAKASGADIVKFQAYTPDELVGLRGDGAAPEPWGSQGFSMRSLYEKARTPLEWFPKIKEHCDRVGMPWFSSVFGPESLSALEAVNCPAYKISHFEHDNVDFRRLVEATGKPIITSRPHPVAWMVENRLDVYCPGGYPCQSEDMKLQHMTGLSSHCRELLAAPLAVALGAKYLEYHFHRQDEPSELESNVSLNEMEFRVMVEMVRRAEVLCG